MNPRSLSHSASPNAMRGSTTGKPSRIACLLGWDDREFHLAEGPYPWCETLSDDCDCHATKGRLDVTYCSEFGSHAENDRRVSRSHNAWHLGYIQGMEKTIADRDRARRRQNAPIEQSNSLQEVTTVAAAAGEQSGSDSAITKALPDVINRINRLIAQSFYCQIEGRYHPCSEETKQKLIVNAVRTIESLARMNSESDQIITASMDTILVHWLQVHQSSECAEKAVRGEPDIPDILYKYIPTHLIGEGAPDSLRATQLRALNDNMECNVVTMNGDDQMDTLAFLTLVQSRLSKHLGITPPWEDLLTRALRYGDLRLSTFIQDYLNPRVGVVSFSTDPLVPTMWAHYANNTGIVVGYDTTTLRSMGFALRPMIYSEIAPTYQPTRDDIIRLSFVDRERLKQQTSLGETPKGLRIIADADLTEMGRGWKELSPLLFIKGTSWAYEQEVRLLVDLEQARDTGKTHNCWAIKVIDPPPEAIKEIYRGDNTRDDDLARAVEVARGENKQGLLVQRVSAHAFRIQRTVGSRY